MTELTLSVLIFATPTLKIRSQETWHKYDITYPILLQMSGDFIQVTSSRVLPRPPLGPLIRLVTLILISTSLALKRWLDSDSTKIFPLPIRCSYPLWSLVIDHVLGFMKSISNSTWLNTLLSIQNFYRTQVIYRLKSHLLFKIKDIFLLNCKKSLWKITRNETRYYITLNEFSSCSTITNRLVSPYTILSTLNDRFQKSKTFRPSKAVSPDIEL